MIKNMENSCKVTPGPKSVKEFFTTWYFWKPFIGIVTGGIAGYLYYHFIGCSSGSCAITGNPFGSTIFGGFLGFFMTGSLCARSGR
jgi:hypothetical protein